MKLLNFGFELLGLSNTPIVKELGFWLSSMELLNADRASRTFD